MVTTVKNTKQKKVVEHCWSQGAELTGELVCELTPEWGEGASLRVPSRSVAGGAYTV